MTYSGRCKRGVFGIFNSVADVSMILWVYCLGNFSLVSILIIIRIYARPLLLALHFYAVALYSIFLLFRKSSVLNYPRTVLKGFDVLAKACIVFIPVVISELLP